MIEPYEKRRIIKITPLGIRIEEDYLIKEEQYTLILNDEEVTVFNCTPSNLQQLALGYCFGKGLLKHKSQILEVKVDKQKKQIKVYLEDCTNDDILADNPRITLICTPGQIHSLSNDFAERCHLYRLTGASHGCALADKNGIVIFMDDVVRHNSLDKVLGAMLVQQIDPAGKLLIFSGRLATDMIEKAIKARVKILVAPGAPTLTAVDLAEKAGITLLGFVRSNSINVYTHRERLVDWPVSSC